MSLTPDQLVGMNLTVAQMLDAVETSAIEMGDHEKAAEGAAILLLLLSGIQLQKICPEREEADVNDIALYAHRLLSNCSAEFKGKAHRRAEVVELNAARLGISLEPHERS